MPTLKNHIYFGADGRESVYDLSFPDNWNNKLVVFIHGYMGYKDWGCWNLVQDFFTNNNFSFLKYNVSHNGGTIENPIDFDDLEAFQHNSYIKERKDLEAIMNLIDDQFKNRPSIYLIGHSRGGGIALLQSTNPKIEKIATWAAISTIKDRFPKGEKLAEWKEKGVYYHENSRTKQQMPHDYSQYESFLANEEKLDIESTCKKSSVPTIAIHGDDDTSVNIEEGKQICNWLNQDLIIVPNTNHTFGSSQPWNSTEMPTALEKVCEITLDFFNKK